MSKRNKSSKCVNNKHKTLRRDKKDFLKELILQSGAPLESEITAFLANQAKFNVDISSGAFYVDKDDGKGRELDVKVSIPIVSNLDKKGIPGAIYLNLLIQCKSIPGNAWVFFKSPYSVYSHLNVTSMLDAIDWTPLRHFEFTSSHDLHFHKIPLTTAYDEHVLNPQKSNKKNDNLFKSIITLVKATDFEIETSRKEFKKIINESEEDFVFDWVHIYYPIVVFDGDMYLVEEIEKREKMKLTPIKHVCLSFDYTSGTYKINSIIHIVHRTEFENFFGQIINDIKIMKDALNGQIGERFEKEVTKATMWYLRGVKT